MLDRKDLLERAAEICRVSVTLVIEAQATRQAAAAIRERAHSFVQTRQALMRAAAADWRQTGQRQH